MRIWISGGAGFIGSNFIHYVFEKFPDALILNYDSLTYAGNLNNLKGLDKNYQFVKADICDEDALASTFLEFKPDYVVHMAAESHVDNSISNSQVFLKTNILGTDAILRAVKNFKIPKMVHISTDEVYGTLEAPHEADENHAFKPNSPYSASKTSGDVLCRAHFQTYGTPVSIIRGSNCYGGRQHPEKFIPKSLTNLLSGGQIPLYGRGINIREWIYVDDFCQGVLTVMLKGKIGEAYNLGGGKENRIINLDIAKTLLKSLDLGEDRIKYVTDRLGHDLRYSLNSQKLRDLGWRPDYSLANGINRTVAWYQENKWWWEKLI